MAAETLQDMLALAVQLGVDAGDIAYGRPGPGQIQRKADNSVVTDTDHAVQRRILEAVGQAYPGHAVCAEETVANPEAHARLVDARYCWVVDPLDGTRNLVAGLPCFATSIAVLERGLPIVGVIREHGTGITYSAIAGDGARVDGRPCRISDWPAEGDLMVALPSNKDPLTQHVLRTWGATRRFILRNFGTTALHMALVATGSVAAVFAKRAKIWDIAAGALLVVEAGGRITDPAGRGRLPFDLTLDPQTDLPVLAAGPNTHAHLLPTMLPPPG